ncbi:hypothetical protein KAR91_15325 [Candidatus Pacearchaeota archaeon]|nr:hypothetical protein [Candidatus Pacearchaeota archaeon]
MTIGTGQVGANPKGGIDVNLQDQHTLALDLKFIQAQGAPTTLAANANPEDMSLTLTSVTGFVAGRIIGLFSSSGIFYFGQQIGAAVGNVISLDTPIDKAFLIGDNVITAIHNMNVDGSSTRQIFQIGPVGGASEIDVDITRLAGYIQDGTAMDDALFGGLSALTYGIVFRYNNGIISNIWNAKSNSDLALLCAGDFNYTEKAPSGSFGARLRNSYAGPEKHGVTIRLFPGDKLEIIIQDNLTGLEVFNLMAQGHIVD